MVLQGRAEEEKERTAVRVRKRSSFGLEGGAITAGG